MIDGDRLSEVAALITLADDTKPVIESVVHNFKKYNDSWGKITVNISDKNFNERKAFLQLLPISPDSNMLVLHTLRLFRS